MRCALLFLWAAVAAATTLGCPSSRPARPHIVFIMADDLGWNDVGFHGSGQIPTPNIDALAYSGVLLHNYYVTAICTPSRSALMTGKHPVHTGMQHTVLFGAEPRGLPLNETILPQHLRKLGYATHLVGKWHLGSYKKEYLPLQRGFDTHLGYWTGHHDYYDHWAVERPGQGMDMRRGMEPAWDLHGKYSTDIFTEEAVRLIRTHNATRPMFLMVAHAAVHSANPYNPLPAPDKVVAGFSHISDYNRRRFAGILTKLDQSVGEVIAALQHARMLQDSVVVFTTDNGGPAAGFNLNAASNWPLKGVKNTLWEGGVRGAALLWSPLLHKRQRVADQMMHITDWLPTLYRAAGGDPADLAAGLDGLDLWEALSEDTASPRTEVLHNIDPIYGNSAITHNDWKLVKGTSYNGAWDSWYGPQGRDVPYEPSAVMSSAAGHAVAALHLSANATTILQLRREAAVSCGESDAANTLKCQPLQAPCLFHIKLDPCEKQNMADKMPEVLRIMEQRLEAWNKTAVPPGNLPLDDRGDPKHWGWTWTNFGDYIHEDANTV